MPNSHLCQSRQPLTTASQCTAGNALDFDTLGMWLRIKLLHSFLLVQKLFRLIKIPDHGSKVSKRCALPTVLWLMV